MLCLPESANPTQAERASMQQQLIEPAQRSAKDVASRLHRDLPGVRVDVQALQNPRELPLDSTLVITANRPTTPVHELQILSQRKRDRRLGCPLTEAEQSHLHLSGRGGLTRRRCCPLQRLN